MPFLDKAFLDETMGLDPQLKMVSPYFFKIQEFHLFGKMALGSKLACPETLRMGLILSKSQVSSPQFFHSGLLSSASIGPAMTGLFPKTPSIMVWDYILLVIRIANFCADRYEGFPRW